MAESKIGEKEAQLRAMREARVAKNKVLIDKTFKPKAVKDIKPPRGKKVVSFKNRSKSSGRGR
jgi:hypothetical protein